MVHSILISKLTFWYQNWSLNYHFGFKIGCRLLILYQNRSDLLGSTITSTTVVILGGDHLFILIRNFFMNSFFKNQYEIWCI